jgi:hypothetical protein
MFPENEELSERFSKILNNNGFTQNEISVAIVDLTKSKLEIFGYNINHFIYPASIYKVFIGAEVLRRVELGEFSLEQEIEIYSPNDVDRDVRIFPGDTRPLLNAGEKKSIRYLLGLMLMRSDNTASNTLIDLVGRENITKNIIHKYNWQGSEVTRKFLDRIKEDKPYQFSSTTLSSSRHLAEFFYLVETNKLISPFVSKTLKENMLSWNRSGRQGLYLNTYRGYYRKGGWLETNLWQYSFFTTLRNIIRKGWAVIRWMNDAGVITGAKSKYVIALLTVNKSILPTSYFPMKKFAKIVYEFMEQVED